MGAFVQAFMAARQDAEARQARKQQQEWEWADRIMAEELHRARMAATPTPEEQIADRKAEREYRQAVTEDLRTRGKREDERDTRAKLKERADLFDSLYNRSGEKLLPALQTAGAITGQPMTEQEIAAIVDPIFQGEMRRWQSETGQAMPGVLENIGRAIGNANPQIVVQQDAPAPGFQGPPGPMTATATTPQLPMLPMAGALQQAPTRAGVEQMQAPAFRERVQMGEARRGLMGAQEALTQAKAQLYPDAEAARIDLMQAQAAKAEEATRMMPRVEAWRRYVQQKQLAQGAARVAQGQANVNLRGQALAQQYRMHMERMSQSDRAAGLRDAKAARAAINEGLPAMKKRLAQLQDRERKLGTQHGMTGRMIESLRMMPQRTPEQEQQLGMLQAAWDEQDRQGSELRSITGERQALEQQVRQLEGELSELPDVLAVGQNGKPARQAAPKTGAPRVNYQSMSTADLLRRLAEKAR